MSPHRPALLALAFLALGSLVSFAADTPASGSKPIQFDRDVRPILSENCFACHGPDANKRKAKIRLDTKEGALAELDGSAAIVPGKPEESTLIDRITSTEPDEKMPPANSEKKLTPNQIEILRRWVASGAEYKGHWAYEKPLKTEPPAAASSQAIDRFIVAKLAEKGLHPSPKADRITLIRRLSFDLIGLPPTVAEVDAFVNDPSPNAYEQVVDRLLASPHHGERMAMTWLDWVRYADTDGYHSDNKREIFLYRDYVIQAFNTNKSFDRFTLEQIAGDLLSNPTREQKIGSGYNRMLMTTEEGGAQAKEYTAKYAADRVRNASTVWLGATLGCAECHDHKFDPYTQKDFYRFGAFFADIQEVAVGRQPTTRVPTSEQQSTLDEFDVKIAANRLIIDTATPALAESQAAWEKTERAKGDRWRPLATADTDHGNDALGQPAQDRDRWHGRRRGKCFRLGHLYFDVPGRSSSHHGDPTRSLARRPLPRQGAGPSPQRQFCHQGSGGRGEWPTRRSGKRLDHVFAAGLGGRGSHRRQAGDGLGRHGTDRQAELCGLRDQDGPWRWKVVPPHGPVRPDARQPTPPRPVPIGRDRRPSSDPRDG